MPQQISVKIHWLRYLVTTVLWTIQFLILLCALHALTLVTLLKERHNICCTWIYIRIIRQYNLDTYLFALIGPIADMPGYIERRVNVFHEKITFLKYVALWKDSFAATLESSLYRTQKSKYLTNWLIGKKLCVREIHYSVIALKFHEMIVSMKYSKFRVQRFFPFQS
jgi:hypothetical protein